MLSGKKLKEVAEEQGVTVEDLARSMTRAGLELDEAVSAIRNWMRELYKPVPRAEDIRRLADALSVEPKEIGRWHSSCKYAPMAARKARLVTDLIIGRPVQDAVDILKFTRRRAAPIVDKVLKAAIADADEQQADVEDLYVMEARVDEAGIRLGTKRWIPKDRGRAHPIRKKACHIHVTVTQA